MDTELWGQDENSHEFAKEVGKTFVLSAVTVIGSMGALIVVGQVASWLTARRDRKLKKAKEKESKTE